jgi:hypothetical protein
VTHHDKALREWIEVGLQGAVAVAGLGTLAYFFYLVDEIDKALGPWPEEVLRQRLNASADELESILESRRRQGEGLREETLRAERSDPQIRAELERIRAIGERERRAEAESLRAERQRLERGDTGPLARLRPKRAREFEVRQRLWLIRRREIGLDGYDFSRTELEQGFVEGILTPGEQELLARMRERETKGEAKSIDSR